MKKAFEKFTVGQKHKGLFHPLEDYNQCFQLVDIDRLKALLQKDNEFMKTTLVNAEPSSMLKLFKQTVSQDIEEQKIEQVQQTNNWQITKNLTRKPSKLLVFGDASLPIQHEFPTHEDIENFPQERLKLQTIGFKRRANISELSGIQLELGHGVKSPLFETQWAKNDDL